MTCGKGGRVCMQTAYASVAVCALRGECGCAFVCDRIGKGVGMHARASDAGRVCVDCA